MGILQEKAPIGLTRPTPFSIIFRICLYLTAPHFPVKVIAGLDMKEVKPAQRESRADFRLKLRINIYAISFC